MGRNGRTDRRLAGLVAVAVMITGALAGTRAQEKPAAPVAGAPAVQPAAKFPVPEPDRLLLLVRLSLLTLNDALQTGNFTVLRDIAAPSFREANTAARLGQIFGPIATQGLDLAAVAVLAPQLSSVPAIDPQSNRLRIAGQFPGQPVGIAFDLVYEPVGGRWRLYGLAVNPVPSATAAPAPASAAPAAAPGQPPAPAAKSQPRVAPAAVKASDKSPAPAKQ